MTRRRTIHTYAYLLTVAVLFLGTSCSKLPKLKPLTLAPTPICFSHGPDELRKNLKEMELEPKVPVFICSTRNLKENPLGIVPYGNGRMKTQHPHYALANVTVGKNVSKSLLRHETINPVEKKKTLVSLESVTPLDPNRDSSQQWFDMISRQLDKGKKRAVIIYVHGFNTKFSANTELMAEFYHYMGRDGAVINFEWPSQGKVLGYFQDKGNAQYSTRYFRNLILKLAQETNAKSVMIVAHSAGNPIMINALREIRLMNRDLSSRELVARYRVMNAVSAAPDMDLMEFYNAVFDGYHEVCNRASIYTYPKDRALAVSSKIFGNQRLGNAVGDLNTWEKRTLNERSSIEMIDVSEPQSAFGNFLGHGYFHRDPWVSSDITLGLFNNYPSERGLVRAKDGLFWEFPKNYPSRIEKRYH